MDDATFLARTSAFDPFPLQLQICETTCYHGNGFVFFYCKNIPSMIIYNDCINFFNEKKDKNRPFMNDSLEKIVLNYRQDGGNVITLLQETQEAFGYIPREAIDYFSEHLGIAPSRFFGVATFYAQFRMSPIGKNKITTCCGTACHVRGAERIVSGIKRELKLTDSDDTTEDREFTVEKVACLGFCSFAPVVLINGDVRGKTSADAVIKEIRSLRNK